MVSSGTFVLGILNGLIIALLAVGFVLVYRANRFLNLAHAQLGVLSAVLLLKVVNDWGWNWWVSFVPCVIVGIATGLLVERFIIGPVRRRTKSPVRLLILTIGVSQVLLALTYIPGLIPTSTAPFPQPFSSNVQLGGVVLSGMSLLTLIAVPVILVLLTLYLEFTSVGKQIRCRRRQPRGCTALRNLGVPRQPDHLGHRRWSVGPGCDPQRTGHDLVQCTGPRSLSAGVDDGGSGFRRLPLVPRCGGRRTGPGHRLPSGGSENEQHGHRRTRRVRSDPGGDPGAWHGDWKGLRSRRGCRARTPRPPGARSAARVAVPSQRNEVADRWVTGRRRGVSAPARTSRQTSSFWCSC